MRTALVVCVLGVGVTLAAQAPLVRVDGGAGDALGRAVACLGDVNGDGASDYAAGAPNDATNGAGAGMVVVCSGATHAGLFTLLGEAPGDGFGTSIAAAGDVNGDGCADLVVGAPGSDSVAVDAGRVRAISGKTGTVLYTWDGDGAGDALGTAVGGAGDVDNDGYADLIAGAPGDDNNGLGSGMARLFTGKTGAVLRSFDGDGAGDAFGAAVSAAGDINGDGFDDVIVGAPGDDNTAANAGMARVFSGVDGSVLFTFDGVAAGDAFGSAVTGLGDVDGDNLGDVAVGAPGSDAAASGGGSVQLRSGATGGVLRTLVGKRPNAALGSALAAADVDGDGFGDVVAGAPGWERRGIAGGGAVQVFSGHAGSLLLTRFGLVAGDALGTSVSAGCDVNDDDYADVLAGAPGSLGGAGSAFIHAQRPFAGLTQGPTLSDAAAGAQFGFMVASVGDLNNDAVPDYAVGAPFDNPNQQGAVYLYSGATHTQIRRHPGPAQSGTWFGHSITPAGDIDRDGKQEILVGAWHFDNGALLDVGRAELFNGGGASMRVTIGPAQVDHMGSAVTGIGDANGDGIDDYVIALGQWGNYIGQVWTYSGLLGNRLVPFTYTGAAQGEWFGWSLATIGDLDSDGVQDFAIGAPSGQTTPTPGNGYVRVISARTGALIRRIDGVGTRDLFGWFVAANKTAGDCDGDGVPDLVVGAYHHDPAGITDAGMARVYSGADGSLLHDVVGTAASEELGVVVASPGDVDGDGYADFMAGAPGYTRTVPTLGLSIGQVTLYSGYDKRVLAQFEGDQWFDGLRTCAGLGDINGDGLADLAVSAPFGDTGAGADAGFVRVFTTKRGSNPGGADRYGASCPGSAGKLPHAGTRGRTAIAMPLTTTLRAAPSSTFGVWNLGSAASAIPLAALRAPGCTLLTPPVLALPIVTDGIGRSTLAAAVPNDPSLVGGTIRVQWVTVDLAANGLGVILSDAVAIKFGQ